MTVFDFSSLDTKLVAKILSKGKDWGIGDFASLNSPAMLNEQKCRIVGKNSCTLSSNYRLLEELQLKIEVYTH